MHIGTGIALIAVGALLAFAFTGELLGADTDALGAALMTVGVVIAALGSVRARRRRRPRPTSRP